MIEGVMTEALVAMEEEAMVIADQMIGVVLTIEEALMIEEVMIEGVMTEALVAMEEEAMVIADQTIEEPMTIEADQMTEEAIAPVPIVEDMMIEDRMLPYSKRSKLNVKTFVFKLLTYVVHLKY